MSESGVDISEQFTESAPEQVKPRLKPRSSISPHEELEKPESLEAQSKRLQKRWGLVKKISAGILMGLAAKGGVDTVSDFAKAKAISGENRSAISEPHNPTSTPSSFAISGLDSESNLVSERDILQKETEEKYDIELLNQREGYERIGKNYNERDEETLGHRPVVRWPKEQLMMADEVLSYFPKSFLTAEGGKKFALSLWDYGSKEEYAGMYHNSFNMISVNENSFTKLGGTAQLLAHELGHKNDSEKLKNKLHEIVDRDKSFLNKKYFHVDGRFYYRNPDIAQVVATFRNMMYEGDGETRANFFQTYIKGYERFMNAVGPVIDGGKFRVDIPRDKLALKYPRAQEIYELYMNVFEGKEFDALQFKLDPDFRYPNT